MANQVSDVYPTLKYQDKFVNLMQKVIYVITLFCFTYISGRLSEILVSDGAVGVVNDSDGGGSVVMVGSGLDNLIGLMGWNSEGCIL